MGKLIASLMVPPTFYLLALAFWKRSILYSMAIITFVALAKSAWSVLAGGESGWAVLPPALIGLGLCNLAVTFGQRWFMRQANAQCSA